MMMMDEWRHQFTFDKILLFIFIFNSSTIFCQTYYIAIFWLSQGFSSYFLKKYCFDFQAGCDLNLVDYENRTPLVSICRFRHVFIWHLNEKALIVCDRSLN